MRTRVISLLLFVLGFGGAGAFGEWTDKTAGLPVVETISAKTIGVDGENRAIILDKLGRLFVGSSRLHVFDGQSWQSFPKPNSYPIYSLAMGDDGKVWAGAPYELGFFQERNPGAFEYHSLLSHLPKDACDFGEIWGCAPINEATYFICRDQLLRWDGTSFEISRFKTQSRLIPMRVGPAWCFYHRETGLYRLTEKGAVMEISAGELKDISMMGMFRDETGLVLVGSKGYFRPGDPTIPFSDENLNRYLTQHVVSAFAELPDGNLALGTMTGGVVLASRTGKLIRALVLNSGSPERVVMGLISDQNGEVLGITPGSFFHFPATSLATIFNAKNGLYGQEVLAFSHLNSALVVLADKGTFLLHIPKQGAPIFKAEPILSRPYSEALPYHGGLLLVGDGVVDWFDGTTTIQTVRKISRVYRAKVFPSPTNTKRFYLTELLGLAGCEEQPDGRFVRTRLLDLPDECRSMQEDPSGRLWIGTTARGAFCYDPITCKLTPVNDPASGEALLGPVQVLGIDRRILIFFDGGILEADAGQGPHPLRDMPAIVPLNVACTPDKQGVAVIYKRAGGVSGLAYGVGALLLADDGQAKWRDLDIATLDMIGPLTALTFTEEDNRPILWVGGTEGILRLEYDDLPTLQPPRAPIIRSDDSTTVGSVNAAAHSFAYKNHRVPLLVFTGDSVRGKDWLIQTRLGTDGSEWSAPTSRRSFEFTHLSEGKYHFEARTVNWAGMASAPASLTFTILPPWYRTKPAYAGYAASLALLAFASIRIRERRTRRHNRDLERLVELRTAELVKANAAKDEFLASVSHEIRNPMNGVIGIAETLNTDALDPAGQHKFSLLRECARHLSSLLEDILDFSRVSAGTPELEIKPFDLHELVESISAMTAAESERRGVPVESAISPGVPRLLNGDSRRVRQILLNFVGNALKFANRGQVSITVWRKAENATHTVVIFAVSDEGPGISPEEQKKLFTRFERGAAAQHGKVPGTGLGLALSKTLAEKMNGRIWLESEPGAGSCFYFSAPFEIGETMGQPAPLPDQSGHRNFKTALVVDDEEYNRGALTDLLESLGITVRTAAEGHSAITLAAGGEFDLIFLDYAMPGQSGPEVARAIRALNSRSAQAAILATTAFNNPEKRAQCLAAGMNAFLGKPVTMERLRRALAALRTPDAPAVASGSKEPASGDRLDRLRWLAAKKNIPFTEEMSRFLAHLEAEREQLAVALLTQNANEAVHVAHLLYGRCAYIGERELELTLRDIEAAAAIGQWAETIPLGHKAQRQLAELQIRLNIDSATVPAGSAH